jgi:hypothetical protein
LLIIDPKGTCTTSGAAGDAWADANAGLAGGAESDVTATTEVIRDNGQLGNIRSLHGIFADSRTLYTQDSHFINKYNLGYRCTYEMEVWRDDTHGRQTRIGAVIGKGVILEKVTLRSQRHHQGLSLAPLPAY